MDNEFLTPRIPDFEGSPFKPENLELITGIQVELGIFDWSVSGVGIGGVIGHDVAPDLGLLDDGEVGGIELLDGREIESHSYLLLP
jgi:hypothetical protein